MSLDVRPVASPAERRAFVELAYALNASDPNWVPPLKDEVRGLIDPNKNPWFEHAEAEFFLAWRGGRPAGRISAQVDRLVQEHMEAGLGQWGMFEAEDETTARALLGAVEAWLKAKGMKRAMGPFSLSIWDEPGLLVAGFDHPPMVMMGHNRPEYAGWIEAAGYSGVKDLPPRRALRACTTHDSNTTPVASGSSPRAPRLLRIAPMIASRLPFPIIGLTPLPVSGGAARCSRFEAITRVLRAGREGCSLLGRPHPTSEQAHRPTQVDRLLQLSEFRGFASPGNLWHGPCVLEATVRGNYGQTPHWTRREAPHAA